jgi:hypothetical protein
VLCLLGVLHPAALLLQPPWSCSKFASPEVHREEFGTASFQSGLISHAKQWTLSEGSKGAMHYQWAPVTEGPRKKRTRTRFSSKAFTVSLGNRVKHSIMEAGELCWVHSGKEFRVLAAAIHEKKKVYFSGHSKDFVENLKWFPSKSVNFFRQLVPSEEAGPLSTSEDV